MPAKITNSLRLIDETLIPIADAPKQFPVKSSRQTLERWLRRGCRGVLLESITIGFRRFTSKEAISRFLSAQAGAQHKSHLHSGGRMSDEDIAKKSREYGLPE